MPELPELEVVREVLQRRVVGHTIDAVRVFLLGSALHRAAIEAGQAVDERRQDCVVTLLARLLPAHDTGEWKCKPPDDPRSSGGFCIFAVC
jgi:hypothetical protein